MSDRPRYIGQPLKRREDDRLVRGEGHYADDEVVEDCLHAAFFRSPFAAGSIKSLETGDARNAPGVISVLVAGDLDVPDQLPVNNAMLDDFSAPTYPVLADGDVRAVGQPVALVVANTRQAANDAVEMILLDVDETSATIDAGGDPAMSKLYETGDADAHFEDAAHVVSATVSHPRLAPTPIEPRSMVAMPDDETGGLIIRMSAQTPYRTRATIAQMLNLEPEQVRVIGIDVGGGFGMKANVFPEEVAVAWAAMNLRKPVRWIATRSEEMLAALQARGATNSGELALDADGNFLAIKANVSFPLGHWIPFSGAIPLWNASRMLPGPYKFKAAYIEARGYLTNTAPMGIYRGAGRPEAVALMERLVEEAARTCGIDAAEIRRRNFYAADELPYKSVTGSKPDSGDFAEALELALEHAGYETLRKSINDRRKKGEICGIGIASFTEASGSGFETASVTWRPDGTVTAATGSSSQGHGREIAFAQIVADEMDIDIDDVTILHGDSALLPDGIGAVASRSTAIGGSAIMQAARDVAEILRQANTPPEEPVTADAKYTADGEGWAHGTSIAVARIDRDTGVATLERIVAVDDAGIIVNPMLFQGQVIGAAAQGIGEALLEQIVYGEDGQLLTGSFMDYAMPRADDIPPMTLATTQTRSPNNLLGAKGVGEAGTISVPAAVLNAVMDALSPFGVGDIPMPLTSERIWQALQKSRVE